MMKKLIALLFLIFAFSAQAATWAPTAKLLADGTACTAATNYQSRWNATSSRIEVCYWNGTSGTWNPALASGGSGGVLTLLPGSTVCDAAHNNQVRINSSTRAIEYCDFNGIGWQSIAISSPGATLVYSTPGNYTWTVPSGITQATFYSGGAGGGYGAYWNGMQWLYCSSNGVGNGDSSSVIGGSLNLWGFGGGLGSGGAVGGVGQVVVNGAVYVPGSGIAVPGGSIDGYSAGGGTTLGGGGGGMAKSTIAVATGTVYNIVVGASASLIRCDFLSPGNGLVVIKY